MRVVWKDTYKAEGYKPFKYRGVAVHGHPYGWTVDIGRDNNIYQTRDDAFNAIDKVLGGVGLRGTSTTRKTGLIRIIGTTNETA